MNSHALIKTLKEKQSEFAKAKEDYLKSAETLKAAEKKFRESEIRFELNECDQQEISKAKKNYLTEKDANQNLSDTMKIKESALKVLQEKINLAQKNEAEAKQKSIQNQIAETKEKVKPIIENAIESMDLIIELEKDLTAAGLTDNNFRTLFLRDNGKRLRTIQELLKTFYLPYEDYQHKIRELTINFNNG